MSKRVIMMKVLPGEPLDGSGRVCVHLFVRDDRGPFVEPHVLHPTLDAQGHPVKQKLVARPTRGRLACNRTRQVAPVRRGNVVTVTHRTDDPRAVTCPSCMASPEYDQLMRAIPGAEEVG